MGQLIHLENSESSFFALLLIVVIGATALVLLPRRDRFDQLFWVVPCVALSLTEALTDGIEFSHPQLDAITALCGAAVAIVLARRAQASLGHSMPFLRSMAISTAIIMVAPLVEAISQAESIHTPVSVMGVIAASCWPMLTPKVFACMRANWERAFLSALILGYAVAVLAEPFDRFEEGSAAYQLAAASHFLGVLIGFVAASIALRQALKANERLAAAERVARMTQEETNRFLGALIDTAPAGVYVKDLDGRYTLVNKVLAGWIDTADKKMLGSTDADLFPPEVVDAVHGLDAHVSATGKPQVSEMQLFRKGCSSERVVMNHKFPLFDSDGNLVAMAGVILDVTHNKLHERELIMARLKAEEANRAKSNFLAHMSHELRTPLNAIIGFSDVIQRGLFGSDNMPLYQQYAGDIHRAGTLLLAQVNDLLDISRVEAGTFEVSLQSVSLKAVAEDCCHLLRDQAERRKVSLAIDDARPLPQVTCDPRATLQVLINLAGNAIKYVPEGSTITIAGGRTESGVDYFLVEDNGPGLPGRVLQALLDPWTHQSAVVTEDGRGGMGLMLSRKLMEVQGGRLVIESSPGKGTRIACQFGGTARDAGAARVRGA